MSRTRAFALLAALVLALPLHAAAQGPDHLLITNVYYDTYVSGEGDEFVRLTNPTGSAVDLSGWKLTDGEGTVTFPSGASLAAGASIYVTGNASAFRLDMVVSPDWEYKVDSDPNVPNMARSGTFVLANTGDEVRLLKADNSVVDAVIWGTSAGSAGWSGPAVPGVPEGVILERQADEATGQWRDTDAAPDWQGTRIYTVGQSHHGIGTFDASGATLFSSPDSTFDVLTGFIDGAQQSLHIELYELTNAYVGDHLEQAAANGVEVRMLMEGTPAAMPKADRDQENSILARIQAAGGDVRFMVTNDTQGIHDRYDYVHAKFGIADGQRVLAMSGNWKPTGSPTDPTSGNREWGAVVRSPDLASYLEDVFADDASDAHRDVLEFGAGTDPRYQAPSGYTENRTVPTGDYAPYFPSKDVGALRVTPVMSPDTSLLNLSGLRPLVRNARSEVLVEQLYAHQNWGNASAGNASSDPDLYLEDAITAARNGASVYVLLNDQYLDPSDSRDNQHTVDYLQGIAQREGLDLHAKLVERSIAALVSVHNKGVVVDGRVAVVGSLNWGRNSAQENRELDLLLDSPDAARFYRDIFWYDWAPRVKPLTDLTVLGVDAQPANLLALPALPAGPVPLPALPAPYVPDPTRAVVRVTIADVGPFGAGHFNVTVTATPTQVGAPELVLHLPVKAIRSGQELTLEQTWDTRLLHAGDFVLHATVDSDAQVRESNEANNDLEQTTSLLASAPGVAVPSPVPLPDVPALPPLPDLPQA